MLLSQWIVQPSIHTFSVYMYIVSTAPTDAKVEESVHWTWRCKPGRKATVAGAEFCIEGICSLQDAVPAAVHTHTHTHTHISHCSTQVTIIQQPADSDRDGNKRTIASRCLALPRLPYPLRSVLWWSVEKMHKLQHTWIDIKQRFTESYLTHRQTRLANHLN